LVPGWRPPRPNVVLAVGQVDEALLLQRRENAESYGFPGAAEQRHALDRDRHVDVRGAHHLEKVAKKTKPGHVGCGMDSVRRNI
jgi:hypothetical protein